MAFEEFSQLSKRRRVEKAEKFKKKVLITIFCSIFVLLCIVGGVFAILHFNIKSGNYTKNDAPSKGEGEDQATKTSNKIVQLLCDPTNYKKKCEDTLTKVVHANASTPSIAPKTIIKAAISAAADEVVKAINKTSTFKFEKPDEKSAYEVCKKLFEDSIEELAESISHTGHEVNDFHSKISDLNTWLSAVYSYQETCVDAFPDGETKNKVKAAVNATQEFISNSLALVSQISIFLQNMINEGEGQRQQALARHLLDYPIDRATANAPPPVDEDGFPKWVGRKERKLVVKTTTGLVANLTVAKDGSGNYTSINDCLKALPEIRTGRIYIHVKEGIYEEYVTVTKKMVNITMYGDGSQKSIVTGNKNFVDGVRTFETATFAVLGEGFISIAMGFRNTAGPEKHQAIALRVQADRSIFLNCRIEGYQDTLYAQAHRQLYRSCYITGTIDFIFGDAASVFQNCLLVVRRPMGHQPIIITAQGRADRHETTGFILHNCKIQPDKDLEPNRLKVKTYLGRPMKEFSRTVIMESNIGDLVQPDGWLPLQGRFGLKTLYYAEFRNSGTGADVSNRVKWAGFRKSISRKDALGFTVTPFLQADSWIKDKPNVPVHYGLYN